MGPIKRGLRLVCALALFGGGCYLLLTTWQTVAEVGAFLSALWG